eukprot:767423-Hanusia_phi.AAC.7
MRAQLRHGNEEPCGLLSRQLGWSSVAQGLDRIAELAMSRCHGTRFPAASSASAASVQYGQQKPAGPSQTIPGLPRMPFAHNKKLFSDLQEKIANLDQYDVERLARRLCDIMDRPSKIAFSELVESVRLIPAEPWQLLGGPWLVKDSAVCEWFWSNPAWEAMTQAGPDGEKLFVPHQIRSVHRAVKQCPVGGVIHVSEGLYRWARQRLVKIAECAGSQVGWIHQDSVRTEARELGRWHSHKRARQSGVDGTVASWSGLGGEREERWARSKSFPRVREPAGHSLWAMEV